MTATTTIDTANPVLLLIVPGYSSRMPASIPARHNSSRRPPITKLTNVSINAKYIGLPTSACPLTRCSMCGCKAISRAASGRPPEMISLKITQNIATVTPKTMMSNLNAIEYAMPQTIGIALPRHCNSHCRRFARENSHATKKIPATKISSRNTTRSNPPTDGGMSAVGLFASRMPMTPADTGNDVSTTRCSHHRHLATGAAACITGSAMIGGVSSGSIFCASACSEPECDATR
jgi:hypothetical protein